MRKEKSWRFRKDISYRRNCKLPIFKFTFFYRINYTMKNMKNILNMQGKYIMDQQEQVVINKDLFLNI